MGWMCVPYAPQVAQPSSQHQAAAPESRNANYWAIAVNMHFFPLHIPQLFAYFLSALASPAGRDADLAVGSPCCSMALASWAWWGHRTGWACAMHLS